MPETPAAKVFKGGQLIGQRGAQRAPTCTFWEQGCSSSRSVSPSTLKSCAIGPGSCKPSSPDTTSPLPAPLSSSNYPFKAIFPSLSFYSQRKSFSRLSILALTQTLLLNTPPSPAPCTQTHSGALARAEREAADKFPPRC